MWPWHCLLMFNAYMFHPTNLPLTYYPPIYLFNTYLIFKMMQGNGWTILAHDSEKFHRLKIYHKSAMTYTFPQTLQHTLRRTKTWYSQPKYVSGCSIGISKLLKNVEINQTCVIPMSGWENFNHKNLEWYTTLEIGKELVAFCASSPSSCSFRGVVGIF